MNAPRPHAHSSEVTDEAVATITRQSAIIQGLLPDIPRFTVIVAAAFPFDNDDMEMEGIDVPTIMQSYLFHLRAVNVHVAVELGLAQAALAIKDDTEGEEDVPFALSVVGAFEGHHRDYALDYDPRMGGAGDEAVEEFINAELDTHIS